ncbi:MAG: phosphoglycerate dehydrogenase [Phycisphaerales bacterium]
MSAKTSFPKGKINVVLVESIHPRAVELFKAEGFQVQTLAGAPDARKLAALAGDAHVLGIRSKSEVTPEILAAAPKLLSVGCFCIGTNQVAIDDACKRGVPVFNSPFSNTRSVAELTIAEAIGLHRGLGDKTMQMHRGDWDKSAAGSHEVRGRTIGIVGYGHIGSQVSVLAEAMGMRVVFFDIVPKMALGNARSVRSLKELLEVSDVVTLHVPATKQTSGMIGKAELARMKKGSFLINNARGSVVDVEALAGALKSGHIAGAALDVFPDEPAAKGDRFVSPLQNLGNVLLTPHVGGSTEEAQEAIAEDVCDKLIKFINIGSTGGAVNVPEVELPEQVVRDGGRTVRPHRILHFHKNVPGVLSKMHSLIAAMNANISAEYLRTNEDVGYVVLDVDPHDGESIRKKLAEIPETIRVRMLW